MLPLLCTCGDRASSEHTGQKFLLRLNLLSGPVAPLPPKECLSWTWKQMFSPYPEGARGTRLDVWTH